MWRSSILQRSRQYYYLLRHRCVKWQIKTLCCEQSVRRHTVALHAQDTLLRGGLGRLNIASNAASFRCFHYSYSKARLLSHGGCASVPFLCLRKNEGRSSIRLVPPLLWFHRFECRLWKGNVDGDNSSTLVCICPSCSSPPTLPTHCPSPLISPHLLNLGQVRNGSESAHPKDITS